MELALKVQERLKENNIHSKVVSMPCMELFDKQSEDFRNDIIDQDSLVVTLEASFFEKFSSFSVSSLKNLIFSTNIISPSFK